MRRGLSKDIKCIFTKHTYDWVSLIILLFINVLSSYFLNFTFRVSFRLGFRLSSHVRSGIVVYIHHLVICLGCIIL